MERLFDWIRNSDLWEYLLAIGNQRTMVMRPESDSIYFECSMDGTKRLDLELFPVRDGGFDTVFYRSHLYTPNGTMVESNTDTVRGERLKKSMKEVVEYYEGGEC